MGPPRRHLFRTLLVASSVLGLLLASAPGTSGAATFTPKTSIVIDGTRFRINGRLTNPGSPARGLLINTRMINAVYDDANPDTTWQWEYPDTGVWDPQRNTDEFVARLPAYARNGIDMVTVGLQGGDPDPLRSETGSIHPEIVTAFGPNGELDPAWMARLDEVIRAADALGIVVDVSLFYRWQDQHITTDQGVWNAVDNVTDWLVNGGYTNVLLEICNECNVPAFDHDILLRDNVWQLIREAQLRSGGKLLVSSSFGGVKVPMSPPTTIAQSDFIAVHCDGKTAEEMPASVKAIRTTAEYRADPKPIVFNECGTDLTKMDGAIALHTSWGYFDQGANNYHDGFQSPAVNWRINTPTKRAFFARALEVTTATA
jgi:hypothetical protein